MSIAYYITAHGYGHGVRACDILCALAARAPDQPLHLVSGLPGDFLRNRLPGVRFTLRPAALDVGMVQRDSIRVDVPATLERVQQLLREWDQLCAAETAWLQEHKINLVVADVPAIPIAAAAQAGIPVVAVANFSWDWIYEEFAARDPGWARAVARFASAYGKADLLLRLPFSPALPAFPRQQDLPLLARPGQARRAELAGLTGARSDRPWVLLSFTSLDWDDAALDRVARLDGYEFFTVRPLAWQRPNIHPVDREKMTFSDVLAAVDIVVSKPGFGLVSECIVNAKPLVYADRDDFREYPIIEAAIRRHLRHQHIPQARLYCGDLAAALDLVTRAPPAQEPLAGGGAEIAARRILSFL